MTEPARKSLVAAAGLLALAAGLRFWGLTWLGLTHFDEGTYTLASKWLATFGREGALYDPVRSPPLFPLLAAASFAAFGVRDWAAIAVSAAAGSLTVVLLFYVGREWFGSRVGLVAALWLAVAEYHLIFSRLALADATYTLLFWAALAGLFKAVASGERAWAVAAGVATGLCWNTKYHGFFPLVITGLWLAAARAWVGKERAPVGATPWRRLALAAFVAAAMYAPWFLIVQYSVGYGELVRTHLEHSAGPGALIVTPPGALLYYFTHWLSPPLLVLALVGIVVSIFDRGRASTFLATAFFFFAASAMFYMSFPRLVVPLVPAVCLFAARGLDLVAARAARPAIAAAAGTALVFAWSAADAAHVLSLRTDAYRRAAEYVRARGAPAVTQMSKNYYFYDDGGSLEVRHHDLAVLDTVARGSAEVVIAEDPIVQRLPQAAAWLEAARGGRAPERVFPIEMYEPVYLQGFDPRTPIEDVPRSFAPFVPGRSEIRVYSLHRE
jgi:4-amino-4-deoxy-L-arabinose transferase-like glycosyltransferase